MDGIYTLSVTWRNANSARIAAWTLPPDRRADRLPELCAALGARELVYLATCNRVEVTVAAPNQAPSALRERLVRALLTDADAEPGRAELRVWGGEGAVEHLMVVAAGLDSARLGEAEIGGQMRRAVKEARDAGTLGPSLTWLFDEALRVSKAVRSDRAQRTGRTSLAEIALDPVRAALKAGAGPVALVGVSPMTLRVAESLPPARILFVNRTPERARAAAEARGGAWMELDRFLMSPPPVVAVVSATAAPGAVLAAPTLDRLAARSPRPVLVDLAVPADIDPDAARAAGLERWDMDAVTAEAARNSALQAEQGIDARERVDAALEEVLGKAHARSLSPVITEIYAIHQESADRAADRALTRGELAALPPDAADAVRRFARDLGRRLAHLPTSGLRSLAAQGGMPAVRGFLDAPNDPTLARLARAADGDAP